ncbi:putative DNA annealing helicase and endonuclease ZRANB3 [Triplophysa rosa]|uniref:DNA annealing helicase and endonuclease ZRANB3 n=1 Tax=Triplophysa rosa TaxID=992332 RepID=A0A9W7T3D0_TRIRA|nr:putative DNA annealing helicase and endonuclease ZRANB3 [Triplophysa rosa]
MPTLWRRFPRIPNASSTSSSRLVPLKLLIPLKHLESLTTVLNEMIQNPAEGQFWQVDHINPVYKGGGQCTMENLQTLCTVCHRMRTAQQAKERGQMKRDHAATKLASDITRFFLKK